MVCDAKCIVLVCDVLFMVYVDGDHMDRFVDHYVDRYMDRYVGSTRGVSAMWTTT